MSSPQSLTRHMICGSEIISHGSITELHDHGQKLHHPEFLFEIRVKDLS